MVEQSGVARTETLEARAERGASAIVVGAGPAGAATAFFLAAAGVDVLLLDRARFPRERRARSI